MSNAMTTRLKDLLMEATIQEMTFWYNLHRLQERYISVSDSDRLEEWPDLFSEDGVYESVPKENADLGFPIAIVHCFGRQMLRDRITALRKANLFEPHTYRHMISGLKITPVDANTVDMESNYLVVQDS